MDDYESSTCLLDPVSTVIDEETEGNTEITEIPVLDISDLPPELRHTLELLEFQDSSQFEPENIEIFEHYKSAGDKKISQTVFDALREKDLWGFPRIYLGIGGVEVTLEYSHLGLSKSVLAKLAAHRGEAIEEESGSSKRKSKKLLKPMKLIMFPLLQEAKDALSYFRKSRIQKKMLYNETEWLVDDENLPAVVEAIAELREEVKKWKEEVLKQYHNERRAYRLRVAHWLNSASQDLVALGEDELDVESLIHEYDAKFPSYQKVVQTIRLSVVGPRPVWSLKKQAQHDAEMAEALERWKQADLSQKQLRLMEEALEADRRAKQEAIAKGATYLESKVFEAVNTLLSHVSKHVKEPGSVTPAKKELIAETLIELEELMKMPGASALSELAAESRELERICQDANANKQMLNEQIEGIKKKLEQKLEFQFTGAIGSRAVPTFMKRKAAVDE